MILQANTDPTPDTASIAPKVIPDDDAPHLLIVDDDSRIRELLSRYLSENGYRVTVAADAATARNSLKNIHFDLMVLAVMMPGESGVELTQSLRDHNDIAILMLTARTEIDDRISGLSAGADDYLAKPFDPRELLLGINNILKRSIEQAGPLVEFVCFGPYTFHLERGELKNANVVIRLTDREQEMLRLFAKRAGETVPRADLLGDSADASERTVDVQINRLRRKIEVDPSNPLLLQTVRGIGYRLMSD
ncbi:MAG: response regulator transcription factor [Rhizobiales bacterium]|nr:response regulator transcription factor [Hyphomicrobiales bacterium]